MHSDHWFAEVFQALPDLVRHLLPGLPAAQSGDSETDDIFRPVAQRLLEQRCGTLAEATRARIEALSLPHLEDLTLALLDFQGADDLQAWFDRRK